MSQRDLCVQMSEYLDVPAIDILDALASCGLILMPDALDEAPEEYRAWIVEAVNP